MTQYVSAEVVIVFAEKATEEAVLHVASQLRATGFVVIGDDMNQLDDKRFLIITASTDIVKKAAERHRFVKPLAPGKVVKPSGYLEGADEDDYLEYVREKEELFQNYNKPNFFDKSEIAELIFLALEDVPLNAKGRALVLREIAKEKKNASAAEQRLTVDTMLPAMRIAGLLEGLVPLHEPSERDHVWKKGRLSLLAPTDTIAQYFGSQLAFYYAWMNSFTVWLLVPAGVGLTAFTHMTLSDYTVDDDPYIPFYSFFMVVWASVFLKNWDRQQTRHAFRWRVLGVESHQQVRPEFRGDIRRCRRTGGVERHYSRTRRLKAYLVSALVTCLMLVVAFKVMVLSLNLQGYIDGQIYLERPLYFPSLSKYAARGAIFDPNQVEYFGIFAFIPTTMHVVVILLLNNFYRQVAEWLTERENHRTVEEHERSLVIKRFLFESFDCYISLFYLGFVQQDITKLRSELISLYTVDSLRRAFCETLLPSLMNLYEKMTLAKKFAHVEKMDDPKTKSRWEDHKGALLSAYTEINRDEHEIFDDYLEMVIQFGYVVLFASAFPLASVLSVLCNVVELKSDLFKMTHVLRRPPPSRADNIGVWRDLMQVMMWLSIFTNTFLFVSSEQLAGWLPQLYRHATEKDVLRGVVEAEEVDHDLVVKKGQVRWVLIIGFVIERFFFLVCVCIQRFVQSTPEDVRTECERMTHVKEQYLLRIVDEREAAARGKNVNERKASMRIINASEAAE